VSVAWFDGVTITVEVAFTTAPLASSPSWTDVSAYVRGIEVDRGRSDEFSKFGPGTCSVTFSNRDRRFDPEYAAGAYFGNLNPMKKIRVRATYSATTYDLFVGFVQGWPQQYEFTFDSTVTVKCVDASRVIESSPLAGSAYGSAVVADGAVNYWPLQDETGANVKLATPLEMYGATTVTSTLPLSEPLMVARDDGLSAPQFIFNSTNVATSGSAMNGLEFWYDSSGTSFVSPELEVYACHDGGRIYFATSITLAGRLALIEWRNTVTDKNAVITDFRWDDYPGVHHVAIVCDGTTMTVLVDGQTVTTSATGAAGYGAFTDNVTGRWWRSADGTTHTTAVSHISTSSTLTVAQAKAHYMAGRTAFGHPYGERTGARVGRVLDEIGWPAADRTLSTGDTVHGPYIPDRQSAMGYMQDAETAEDGYLFIGKNGNVVLRDRNWQWTQASVGTFSDDGSDIPYEAITIDANSLEPLRTAVSVTYGPNDAYLKVEDSTAKTAYGPALEALSTPTLDSSLTARSLAQYRLRAWKDPATRITELTVQPRAKAATAYPVVLALELGDRITVERTPGNPVVGSQIVKSLTVQGISHSIDVDGTWLTTLYLSPAPALGAAVPYLIVGDATYGQIGAGPGNKIPF
jgi:hypothetical protein